MPAAFADRIDMQNRLFAELSRMFGLEVPLYDKSLLVNRVCNRTVCELLGALHQGFAISDEQLDRASGERHGAIRIGKPQEYRWVCRLFSAFAMEPHNYYDMSNVGRKSQPIVATAFRSMLNPEHRVFCSLLMTDYFDAPTKARIDALLARRQVFSDRAKALIEKGERDGGLEWSDAEALIREGVDRIFKWTGEARDHQLYRDLCESGFKIAADIACFETHHLNHLTPNTLCMDLYTAAMKRCMGEMDAETFRQRAVHALERLAESADRHWMRLHFRHFTNEALDAFGLGEVDGQHIDQAVDAMMRRLGEPDLALHLLEHSGFKDFTEGPSWDVPVLLRQDAYKALKEPVRFHEAGGSVVDSVHTARFGEIEQRFYAITPEGRALYDECLANAEAVKERDPELMRRDFPAYEAQYAGAFARFPKTLSGLHERGLVYVRYRATASGKAAVGSIETADMGELLRRDFVRFEGLRYEDFLPVSAAGIFASNLSQYGTQSTAAERPTFTQAMLEEIMGRPIQDAGTIYVAVHAASLLETYAQLGVLDHLDSERREELESAAAPLQEPAGKKSGVLV